MKRFPSQQKVILLLIAFISCSLPQLAFTQERMFPDQNCAITLPEDWRDITGEARKLQPGIEAAYANQDKSKVVIFLVPSESIGPLTAQTMAEYEYGASRVSGAPKLVSATTVELEGFKAYQRICKGTLREKALSTLNLIIPTKNKLYNLMAMNINGSAAEDPAIQKIFSSFRFLSPPEPPVPTTSAAYRAGYFMGYLGCYVLLFCGVIAAIFIAVSRRSKPTIKPPPLPPPIPS